MPYDLEPEIQQCEGDSLADGIDLRPVFCTTPLSTEDIKSLILATQVDTDTWMPTFVFLDTSNSDPASLSSLTHATRHPSPPLTSPFSPTWTPRDFYNFFNLHLRANPDAVSRNEAGNFSKFTFLIVSEATISSPDLPVTVCTDAPDFFESEDAPPVLKTRVMPFKDLVQVIDCYELCIQCISEWGQDNVMSQQPPASIMVDRTKPGIQGTVATANQMRRNRFPALRGWVEMLKEQGKAEDARAKVEAVTYED